MLPDEKDEKIHLRSMLYPIKNAKLVFKKQWTGYMHNRDLNKLQYIELESDFTDYALISEKILTPDLSLFVCYWYSQCNRQSGITYVIELNFHRKSDSTLFTRNRELKHARF